MAHLRRISKISLKTIPRPCLLNFSFCAPRAGSFVKRSFGNICLMQKRYFPRGFIKNPREMVKTPSLTEDSLELETFPKAWEISSSNEFDVDNIIKVDTASGEPVYTENEHTIQSVKQMKPSEVSLFLIPKFRRRSCAELQVHVYTF